MDRCRHVSRITPAADHSILNPQKWLCSFCGTTESVWACLSCSNVACGRYNEEHALRHYHESKHPLAIEVNEKYVYCYECGDYILNDNAAGDIKILRSALSAIATHTFSDFESRGKRVLRSMSYPGHDKRWEDDQKLRSQDRRFTAVKFRRYYLLARSFSAWRHYVKAVKQLKAKAAASSSKRTPPSSRKVESPPLMLTLRKRPPVIPGVTGLRNLGNTCYMNSILQVLRSFLANFSQLREFHEYFLAMKNSETSVPPGGVLPSTLAAQQQTRLMRQSTLECFKYINAGSEKKGGLNGGGSTPHRCQVVKSKDAKNAKEINNTLCEELHALFRVMWSGKWAVVSPHKMLYAVWNFIPFFKGYTQQDAQEFLCEFINKVQFELTQDPSMGAAAGPSKTFKALNNYPSTSVADWDFITQLFQGQLVSEVTCRRCGHKSQTYEPFTDLSLEFPDRFQARAATSLVKAQCQIEEMLFKFTETEKLEGRIYACDQCNNRRRSVSPKPTVLTEVTKQLLIHRLPPVLRLHLKRFMWSGRNHRGKITSHVKFEDEIDMKPYCHDDVETPTYQYQLAAVVMHHGRGFGSGHYTAFCYNNEAESWVHCNDARVSLTTSEEVTKAQAYILFYTRTDLSSPLQDQQPQVPTDQTHLFEEQADDEIVFNFQNSTIPKFVELKRRLSVGSMAQPAPKRRRSTFW